MKSFEYIPLSSWLGNADSLYLDARVLWLQVSGMGGGLILMWLAIEQLMKMLIFQWRIENDEHSSKTSAEMFKELDSWGRKINHRLSDILRELNTCYPNFFQPEEIATLKNVYDHFEARYVDNKSRGIEIKALNTLDDIFFKLRDLTSEDLPIGYMDMIDINRKSKLDRLGYYTKFAHVNNPHFHKRVNYRV